MQKKLIFSAFVLAVLPGIVFARDTAELRVTGRIVPDACVPVFSNGGIVRYSQIPEAASESEVTTVLDKKTVTLSITCSFAANLAIKVVDNRRAPPLPLRQFVVANKNYNEEFRFGLGASSTRNSGYLLSFSRAETGSPSLLQSTSGEHPSHWTTPEDNAIRRNTLYTWGNQGTAAATGSRFFRAALNVQGVVQGGATPAKDAAAPEGSVTFELLYL